MSRWLAAGLILAATIAAPAAASDRAFDKALADFRALHRSEM